jgi:hypothetical protein
MEQATPTTSGPAPAERQAKITSSGAACSLYVNGRPHLEFLIPKGRIVGIHALSAYRLAYRVVARGDPLPDNGLIIVTPSKQAPCQLQSTLQLDLWLRASQRAEATTIPQRLRGSDQPIARAAQRRADDDAPTARARKRATCRTDGSVSAWQLLVDRVRSVADGMGRLESFARGRLPGWSIVGEKPCQLRSTPRRTWLIPCGSS